MASPHFEDVEMEGHPLLPSLTSITSLRFRVSEPGTFSDWHTESQRNYIITLSGEGEIGIGDGTHRRFGAGAVMLVEDLTGQGHTTRATSDEPRITVAVSLANPGPRNVNRPGVRPRCPRLLGGCWSGKRGWETVGSGLDPVHPGRRVMEHIGPLRSRVVLGQPLEGVVHHVIRE